VSRVIAHFLLLVLLVEGAETGVASTSAAFFVAARLTGAFFSAGAFTSAGTSGSFSLSTFARVLLAGTEVDSELVVAGAVVALRLLGFESASASTVGCSNASPSTTFSTVFFPVARLARLGLEAASSAGAAASAFLVVRVFEVDGFDGTSCSTCSTVGARRVLVDGPAVATSSVGARRVRLEVDFASVSTAPAGTAALRVRATVGFTMCLVLVGTATSTSPIFELSIAAIFAVAVAVFRARDVPEADGFFAAAPVGSSAMVASALLSLAFCSITIGWSSPVTSSSTSSSAAYISPRPPKSGEEAS